MLMHIPQTFSNDVACNWKLINFLGPIRLAPNMTDNKRRTYEQDAKRQDFYNVMNTIALIRMCVGMSTLVMKKFSDCVLCNIQ